MLASCEEHGMAKCSLLDELTARRRRLGAGHNLAARATAFTLIRKGLAELVRVGIRAPNSGGEFLHLFWPRNSGAGRDQIDDALVTIEPSTRSESSAGST